jgi:type I restriction enzyme, S subunit
MIQSDKSEKKKSGKPHNQDNQGSDILPEGWKWVKATEVCNKIQDGSHWSPKMQYKQKEDGKYLYITSKNIRNNYLDLSNIAYVDKEFHDSIYPRCNPEYGDVLLTKDGVNTGNVTLNTLHEEFSLLSSVCLIKPNQEILVPSFLKYYLQSPQGFREITGAMSGTAIKRIILKRIKQANVLLPPLDQQHQIVAEIERRFSEAENLEKSMDEGLEKAEALRQSILKSAFEGRLVSE